MSEKSTLEKIVDATLKNIDDAIEISKPQQTYHQCTQCWQPLMYHESHIILDGACLYVSFAK